MTDLPPPQLMLKTYLALEERARNALLADWATLHPAPEYYPYQPQLTHTPSWAWTSSSPEGYTR